MPRISLVIPTKNRAACLAELIATLKAQSMPDWEAIIVDDGSDPEQRRGVLESTRGDSRFTVVERGAEPAGGGHCRNIGTRLARADLIVFFDDDDLLSPTCLEARVRAMDDSPDHDFIVFPYERFKVTPGDLQTYHRSFASEAAIDAYLRIEPPFHTGSAVWRRRFLDRLGGWDERIASWQDWEFGLRALCLRPTCGAHEAPRFFVRTASEQHRNISVAWSPKHVHSWPVAIEAGLAHLRAAGLLTASRARLLGKLILFVAERHVGIGERAEAGRLWRHARDEQLATWLEWQLGRVVLAFFGVPLLHRGVRFALRRLV